MKSPIVCGCLAAALLVAAPASGSWSAPETVPGSSGAVLSELAVARDGTVAVAWASAKVAIRRSGGSWLRVRDLSLHGRAATSIDVEFDAHDRLVVTWTQSRTSPGRALAGPYEIRAVTWSRRGGWGAARVLGRSRNFHLAQPRVATNARGDAVISWRGFRHQGKLTAEALASCLRPRGGRFGPERDASGGGPYRDVALDLRGNVYGVFTTYEGPRSYFVYQRRGHGWQRPQRLPGSPSSKPRIAVGADRTAVITWRAAPADSEGNGIQEGEPWAIMHLPSGGFTFPVRLSSVLANDVYVTAAGSQYLLTWAQGAGGSSTGPEGGDLHVAVRGEGNHIGGELVVPDVRIGPAGYLGSSWLVVYGSQGGVWSASRPLGSAAFQQPTPVSAVGLYPALAVRGRRAVATWFEEPRRRLRLAELTS